MILRILAALVALAVIIGVVQGGELRSSQSVATDVTGADDLGPDFALGVPVEPVVPRAPIRQLIASALPALDRPAIHPVSARTFRPPRS